jgi:hypothetical protein
MIHVNPYQVDTRSDQGIRGRGGKGGMKVQLGQLWSELQVAVDYLDVESTLKRQVIYSWRVHRIDQINHTAFEDEVGCSGNGN